MQLYKICNKKQFVGQFFGKAISYHKFSIAKVSSSIFVLFGKMGMVDNFEYGNFENFKTPNRWGWGVGGLGVMMLRDAMTPF